MAISSKFIMIDASFGYLLTVYGEENCVGHNFYMADMCNSFFCFVIFVHFNKH